MATRKALIANLERCIGCLTCEVACKQEHNLAEGEKWIHVETIGPHQVNGVLSMDFVPQATDGCDLCISRISVGKRPSCVEVCPTQALGLYDEKGMLHLLRNTSRTQICKIGN